MKENSEIQLTDEQMGVFAHWMSAIHRNELFNHIYDELLAKEFILNKEQVSNSQVKAIYNLIVQKL